MSKQEMRCEIQAIKTKLLNPSLGCIERQELLVALICLYESALKAS